MDKGTIQKLAESIVAPILSNLGFPPHKEVECLACRFQPRYYRGAVGSCTKCAQTGREPIPLTEFFTFEELEER